MAVPPPEAFIALETTQAVRNAVLKRQLLFQEEDTKQKSGRTLSRLHMTAPRMNVKGKLYASSDGAIPLDPMSQPSQPAVWMPEVHADSDIPLQERDAKTLEALARQGLNICSVQDHTLTAIKSKLDPVLASDTVLQELIQTLSLSLRDMVKVSSHLLTSIVQLRRDAFLLHALDVGSCRALRHAPILHETELFPRQDIEAITEDWRKRKQDLSLRYSAQAGRANSRSRSHTKSKRRDKDTSGNRSHKHKPAEQGYRQSNQSRSTPPQPNQQYR